MPYQGQGPGAASLFRDAYRFKRPGPKD